MAQSESHRETVTTTSSGGDKTTSPQTTTTEQGSVTSSGGDVTTSPRKTTTTTTTDPYKTEFVKVYQDAGAIGVAMLSLLVISALLAILTFRVVKMYSSLVTARDSLDASRVTVIEKLTESILAIRVDMGGHRDSIGHLRDEIMINREEGGRHRDAVLAELRYVCDRVDRALGEPPRPRRDKKPGRG